MAFDYDDLEVIANALSAAIREVRAEIATMPTDNLGKLQRYHAEQWLDTCRKLLIKTTDLLQIEESEDEIEPCPYHERGLECRNSAPAGYDADGEPFGDQGCGCHKAQ